ncbi:MAG: TonB family protein [Acidobacteriia bacterium]|nr:TonB family protein [Terriglobia bacterium]
MSAAPLPALETTQRRAFPRQPVHVPLDVIALRSGIPENLPGRCTDLSETGVGAIIAGELVPDQQIAVELRLPDVGVPVRARALVRYQKQLRFGLQFVGLPMEQQEMIRYWLYRSAAKHAQGSEKSDAPKADPVTAIAPAATVTERRVRRIRVRLRRFYALAALTVSLTGLAWWQWQRSWNELEAQASFAAAPGSRLRVSPEIMERRIVYKENPVYPEAARLAGKQGMVVLDAVIGADGTVRRVRAISGADLLAQSAADAVQLWKFEPYQADGKPSEIETTIAVEFRLN